MEWRINLTEWVLKICCDITFDMTYIITNTHTHLYIYTYKVLICLCYSQCQTRQFVKFLNDSCQFVCLIHLVYKMPETFKHFREHLKFKTGHFTKWFYN